jgi:FkbM family methyltransferase
MNRLLFNALITAQRIADFCGAYRSPLGGWIYSKCYFSYKYLFEDPLAGIIRQHRELFKSGDLIDIGSNVGYCARLLSKAGSPSQSVIGFEPEPRNFALLERNTRNTAADQSPIRCFPWALSSSSGSCDLWVNKLHPGDHRIGQRSPLFESDDCFQKIAVPTYTLDDALDQLGVSTVGFIKIDVQGHELAVCRGLDRTLKQNPQAGLLVELSFDQENTAEALEILRLLGAQGRTPAIREGSQFVRTTPETVCARGKSYGWIDVLFLPATQ